MPQEKIIIDLKEINNKSTMVEKSSILLESLRKVFIEFLDSKNPLLTIKGNKKEVNALAKVLWEEKKYMVLNIK